jgi:hypothetical protein
MKDLVVLVADKNIQFAMQGALHRHQALGIRPIDFDFRPHPGRDGGARTTGVDMLAREKLRFKHAMLVFDLEGSGAAPGQTCLELEHELDTRLHHAWGAGAKAIVAEPEADIWLWGAEGLLKELLQWDRAEGPRAWLKSRGFVFDAFGKPERPKEAIEALVRLQRQPRSSALYQKVTNRISLTRCSDPAYLRLRATLRGWFPAPP